MSSHAEIQINIDCADPDALSAFYCEALGYEPHGGAGQYRSITASDGRPKIVFQQVPESKAAKNRVHLDVIVGPDIELVAEQLTALGATRVERRGEFGLNWIVMHDPEGNELCICDA